MLWQVEMHTEVAAWMESLDDKSYDGVIAALRALQRHGPALGRPLVDAIEGSRYRNMKELRPGSSGRSEIRILFAFDPVRRAILLVGGDKSGGWTRWYRRAVAVADERFEAHLNAGAHAPTVAVWRDE